MTTIGHNRLPELAGAIRTAHAAAEQSARSAVQRGIEAGASLIEAKAIVKHGEWIPWLKEHCGLSPRSAQRYMRLSRNKDRLVKNDTVSHLTLQGALDALDGKSDLERALALGAESEALWQEGLALGARIDTACIAEMGYIIERAKEITLQLVENRLRATRELGIATRLGEEFGVSADFVQAAGEFSEIVNADPALMDAIRHRRDLPEGAIPPALQARLDAEEIPARVGG